VEDAGAGIKCTRSWKDVLRRVAAVDQASGERRDKPEGGFRRKKKRKKNGRTEKRRVEKKKFSSGRGGRYILTNVKRDRTRSAKKNGTKHDENHPPGLSGEAWGAEEKAPK